MSTRRRQLVFSILTVAVTSPLASIAAGLHMPSEQRSAPRPDARMLPTRRATGLATTPLRSLILVGRVRSGFNMATGVPLAAFKHIEIRVLVPDAYERIEEDGEIRRKTGFDRGRGFLKMEAIDRRVRVGQGTPDAEFARLMRLEIARVLLGSVGDTCGVLPLTYDQVRSGGGSQVRVRMGETWHDLMLDSSSALPVALHYRDTVTVWTGGQRGDREVGIAQRTSRKVTDVSVAFEDRRVVGGISVPHRIQRVANGVRHEEIVIERVEVNAPLRRDTLFR